MLAALPLTSHLCERPHPSLVCCACKEAIENHQIYYVLFDRSESHPVVPIHQPCARFWLEAVVVKREQRGIK
jgi:hypothetical protein